MNKGLTKFQPHLNVEALSILQRIAVTDRSAVADCIDTYGGLVWSTAQKHTNSNEEAEKMVKEIFKDIWNCASKFDPAAGTEDKYILRLIFRRLVKHQFLTANSSPAIDSASPLYLKNKGIHKKPLQI